MNTIESILQSLPSREDLASAVGLESRSSATDFLPALGIFGTGMLFGAGLALLFAPKTGRDMRREFSEGLQQWGQGREGYAGGQYGQQMSSQGEYGQRGQMGQQGYEHGAGYEAGRQGYQAGQKQHTQGTQTAEQSRQHTQGSSSEYGRQMTGQGETGRQQMSGQQGSTPGKQMTGGTEQPRTTGTPPEQGTGSRSGRNI